MLDDTIRQEIETEARRYADRRAVCIDALKIVQRHHGWVSDEAIADLAGLLEMSSAELDGVATFYNLIFRKPVGRHVILLCDSVSCWIMGYNGIRDALRSELRIELGETSADGRFTLLPSVCLGACDHAPVLLIDRDLHHDLRAETVAALLTEYQEAK